ncbi:MAG: metallophosphoesterase [Bacteroidales bacterium]|jgi:metallophosphoesterase superfamily enzyme|nr:metallophosphoesterase [Bacteroidales bacterium]
MKHNYFFLALIMAGMPLAAQTVTTELPGSSSLNFIVISDHGRNGHSNQKEVAEMMGEVADDASIRFVVTGGDNFQTAGVQSVSDPLWWFSHENLYTHPSLNVDWYPALGNHDHGGNIQAQIDYSNISRRWKMPAPYYTLVKTRNDVSIRLIILDTYSMVEGFGSPDEKYTPEAARKQVSWADSVLSAEKEDWVILLGHHPVYSAHPSRQNTEELVEYLLPVMKKHDVDFFIGAHDHIFQHLKDSTGIIDYFVNTAGSSVRPAATNTMTQFTASSPGFSIVSATKTDLSMYFINIEGKVIYKYVRNKTGA